MYFLFFLERYIEKKNEIINNGKIVDKLPAWIDIVPIPPDSETPIIKNLIITAGIWIITNIFSKRNTFAILKLIFIKAQKNKIGGKTRKKNKKNSTTSLVLYIIEIIATTKREKI